jgi:hypothetical protein
MINEWNIWYNDNNDDEWWIIWYNNDNNEYNMI